LENALSPSAKRSTSIRFETGRAINLRSSSVFFLSRALR
jgi:hypothetical protein